MKRIWAPWRMPYIEGSEREPGCFLCHRLSEEDGPGNLIFHRGDQSFVILNRYPYSNGHMMVVPYQHCPTTEELPPNALLEIISLANQAMSVLRAAYGAAAFNLGANIGGAAGAGLAEHVHLHVLPRWSGDSNFLSTTAETRVIPESLEETYHRLRRAWQVAK